MQCSDVTNPACKKASSARSHSLRATASGADLRDKTFQLPSHFDSVERDDVVPGHKTESTRSEPPVLPWLEVAIVRRVTGNGFSVNEPFTLPIECVQTTIAVVGR
jgi:hypothetical protein